MRPDSDRHDDDLDLEKAGLISDSKSELPEVPMCGFMSVRYYQPYFDIDTTEVVSRMLQAAFYCRREQNFMASVESRPDGYGPFWIATTLVFVLGVASHLNGWFTSWLKGATMEYNFQSILNASSVIYGFATLAPAGFWLVFRTYEQKLKYAAVLCLYGYSLLTFIPAVVVCLVPSESVTWLALLLAATTSTLFLLRNFGPLVVAHNSQHAAVLLTGVGLVQLIFAFVLKLQFFYQ